MEGEGHEVPPAAMEVEGGGGGGADANPPNPPEEEEEEKEEEEENLIQRYWDERTPSDEEADAVLAESFPRFKYGQVSGKRCFGSGTMGVGPLRSTLCASSSTNQQALNASAARHCLQQSTVGCVMRSPLGVAKLPLSHAQRTRGCWMLHRAGCRR